MIPALFLLFILNMDIDNVIVFCVYIKIKTILFTYPINELLF